jgi:starvation-inducible DNA-binding protein
MATTEDKLGGRRQAALATPSDLGFDAVKNISGALNGLLANVFALYVKPRTFIGT